jgi:hypothetical protein
LAVGLAFAALVSYRHFAGDTAERKTPATARDGDDPQARREDCRLACERLRICRHPLAGERCAAACETEWDHEQARCVQQAACNRLDAECLLPEPEISCLEACERIVDCQLLGPHEECESLCAGQWDQEMRRCFLDTECDEIESVCFPAVPATPCTDFCVRLTECGLQDFKDETDCQETCLAIDEPALRDCVTRVSCEVIELVCLAEDYDPLCLDACDRLDACGAMGDLSADYCPVVCMSAWDDVTISCLLAGNCEQLGPLCLGRPDPTCVDVCRKLTVCEMETDIEDCAFTCTLNLADEARQCLLETPCEEIDAVCFGEQPDICRAVCDKAIGCGLDEDFEACYDSCVEGYDLQLIGCVLAYPCDAIAENCLR